MTPILHDLETRGWKPGDLADQLGVTPTTVRRWMKGKKPLPARRVAQLEALLEVEPPEHKSPGQVLAAIGETALGLIRGLQHPKNTGQIWQVIELTRRAYRDGHIDSKEAMQILMAVGSAVVDLLHRERPLEDAELQEVFTDFEAFVDQVAGAFAED